MICGFFMDKMDKQNKSLLVLIGPMGAGKTTIGRLLAQQLDYTFYDSDIEVERSTGATISWIFEKEGEAGFRVREHKAITEIVQRSQVVLATGGGAVVTPENHAYLRQGIVIYLRATVAVQYERIQRDRHRPLLQTADPKQRLTELFEMRDPIYQSLADITVTTGSASPKKMVHEILGQLAEAGFSRFSQLTHLLSR